MKYFANTLLHIHDSSWDINWLVLLRENTDFSTQPRVPSSKCVNLYIEHVYNDEYWGKFDLGDTVRLATEREIELFIKLIPETQFLIQHSNNHYEAY